MKQINSQSDLISMSSFAGTVLPHNQILCLHHFNSRSLYFQCLQCLPNLILLDTWETHQCALHFNVEITRTNFLQLQPSIRSVPAQVRSTYFTVERANKTLHQISPCTPVSVPAKITWYEASIHRLALGGFTKYLSFQHLQHNRLFGC